MVCTGADRSEKGGRACIRRAWLDATNQLKGVSIRVRGLVQGVGFRPTVWRLAKRFGLTGDVRNDSEGVLIRAFGHPTVIVEFESCARV